MRKLCALSTVLWVSACGSSPVNNPGNSDLAGAHGGDLTIFSDGGICGYPTPPNPEFTCAPSGAGACQSCSDCQQIENGTAKMAVVTCGTSCIGSPSSTCTADCLKKKTTLSTNCIGCFAQYYQCLVANCLTPCTVGQPADCTMCSRTKPGAGAASCSGVLESCSGAQANPSYKP
jgi:hypothetical protein